MCKDYKRRAEAKLEEIERKLEGHPRLGENLAEIMRQSDGDTKEHSPGEGLCRIYLDLKELLSKNL